MIPARDEASRIEDCLSALSRQRDMDDQALGSHDYGAVLVANLREDNTVLFGLEACLRPVRFRIASSRRICPRPINANTPRPGAGHRLLLGWKRGVRNGILLPTDADTQVGGDWVARTINALLCASCSAVVGRCAGSGRTRPMPIGCANVSCWWQFTSGRSLSSPAYLTRCHTIHGQTIGQHRERVKPCSAPPIGRSAA